jgi:hypothetical protein
MDDGAEGTCIILTAERLHVYLTILPLLFE